MNMGFWNIVLLSAVIFLAGSLAYVLLYLKRLNGVSEHSEDNEVLASIPTSPIPVLSNSSLGLRV